MGWKVKDGPDFEKNIPTDEEKKKFLESGKSAKVEQDASRAFADGILLDSNQAYEIFDKLHTLGFDKASEDTALNAYTAIELAITSNKFAQIAQKYPSKAKLMLVQNSLEQKMAKNQVNKAKKILRLTA